MHEEALEKGLLDRVAVVKIGRKDTIHALEKKQVRVENRRPFAARAGLVVGIVVHIDHRRAKLSRKQAAIKQNVDLKPTENKVRQYSAV